MKKKIYMSGIVILLGLILIAVTLQFRKTFGTSSSSVEEQPAQSQTSQAASPPEYHSSALEDKSETVYVKATPTGTPREITVETTLKNPGGNEKIPDQTILNNIKNTKGDEDFTLEEDGTILWDDHGEDIYYKGTTDAALPVSVNISYYLDDQPITPEEIAGKSGRVRIRFDYENHTAETVAVEGREIEVQVPFAVCTAAFLPSDTFYNVEVTNGKVISMDDQNMVVGYACPGLADSLKLTDYEPTKDVKIPDHVEITADVSDFELEFTATVITSGLFEDMDTDDLENVEDLTEDMKELTDASQDLVDAAAELYDGVVELQDGVKEYTDGVRAVDEGIDEVKAGLDNLYEQKTPLREGAEALQSGLDALDAALTQITLPGSTDAPDGETSGDTVNGDASTEAMAALAADLEAISQSVSSLQERYSKEGEELPEELTTMTAAVTDIQTQFENLQSSSEEAASSMAGLSGLVETLGMLKTSVSQLSQGSKQLTEGVQAYTHGVTLLYKGTIQLSEGSTKLWESSFELNDGLGELVDGVQEFKDGVKEFDEDGIRELANLAGDDLKAVIRRVRALKNTDDNYQNFAGIQEGQSGSVKFIIETDEIKR